MADKPALESVLAWAGVDCQAGRTKIMTFCPFHDSKGKHLSVNFEKGLWQCFSCGEAGDAWSLIEKVENTDFRGAVQVAAEVGFETSKSEGQGRGSRKRGLPKRKSVEKGSWIPPWQTL